MLNTNFNDRRIVIKCMNTDFENEHIKTLMQQLGGILLGIGIGKAIAVFLELSSPDLPFGIAAFLVAAGLLFCIQQMLMRPVLITLGPNDVDQFEIQGDRLCWSGSSTDGSDRQIQSMFNGKFTAIRERSKEGGTILFRFSGKPSKEFIRTAKVICKDYMTGFPYHFQNISFVLELCRQEDSDRLYNYLVENRILRPQEGK